MKSGLRGRHRRYPVCIWDSGITCLLELSYQSSQNGGMSPVPRWFGTFTELWFMDVRYGWIFFLLIALLSDVNYCNQTAKLTSVQGWILDKGLLLWLVLLEAVLTSHRMLYNAHEYCMVCRAFVLLQVSTWLVNSQKMEKQLINILMYIKAYNLSDTLKY